MVVDKVDHMTESSSTELPHPQLLLAQHLLATTLFIFIYYLLSLLFIIYYLLFITYYLLFIIYYLLFIIFFQLLPVPKH